MKGNDEVFYYFCKNIVKKTALYVVRQKNIQRRMIKKDEIAKVLVDVNMRKQSYK